MVSFCLTRNYHNFIYIKNKDIREHLIKSSMTLCLPFKYFNVLLPLSVLHKNVSHGYGILHNFHSLPTDNHLFPIPARILGPFLKLCLGAPTFFHDHVRSVREELNKGQKSRDEANGIKLAETM